MKKIIMLDETEYYDLIVKPKLDPVESMTTEYLDQTISILEKWIALGSYDHNLLFNIFNKNHNLWVVRMKKYINIESPVIPMSKEPQKQKKKKR